MVQKECIILKDKLFFGSIFPLLLPYL